MRIIFILFYLLSFVSISAQNEDWIIFEKKDTSLSGTKVIEINDGKILLSIRNVYYIDGETGVPIEGFPLHGTEIYQLDSNLQPESKLFLRTGWEYGGSLQYSENKTFVVYRKYTGFEECYHPFLNAAAEANDLGIFTLNEKRDDYIQDTVYLHRDTAYCGQLKLINNTICNDYLFTTRYHIRNTLLVQKTNLNNLALVESYLIKNVLNSPSRALFDCEEQSIIINTHGSYYDYGISKIKLDGTVEWKIDSIGRISSIMVSEDKKSFWIRNWGSSSPEEEKHTRLYQITNTGEIIQKRTYSQKFIKIDIWRDEIFVGLENVENGFRLYLLDNLGNIISSKSFYHDCLLAKSFTILSNNQIIISASHYRASSPTQCIIEDENTSPNKIMLIKMDIDEIWNPDSLLIKDLIFYPNPTRENIQLIFQEYITSEDNINFFVYDTFGQVVKSGSIDNSWQTISLMDIPSGLYIISILKNQKLIRSEKIIKQ